jgi:hypothetical protein
VVDKLAVAFATAQRAIERLERARIVIRVGETRSSDCATALQDIREEPYPPEAGRQQTALTALEPETCL